MPISNPMNRPPRSAARHAPHRKPSLLLAVLPALCLGACIAEPGRDERGPLASAQRLLALDFGRQRAADRLRRFEQLPMVLNAELRRGRTVADELPGLSAEAKRVRGLWRDARDGARSELTRQPRNLARLLPSPHELAQRTADGLYVGTLLFGSGLHPLGEISDHEHRTEHTDDRPEVPLWRRIWRRLGL